jgi:hypothetical protein
VHVSAPYIGRLFNVVSLAYGAGKLQEIDNKLVRLLGQLFVTARAPGKMSTFDGNVHQKATNRLFSCERFDQFHDETGCQLDVITRFLYKEQNK